MILKKILIITTIAIFLISCNSKSLNSNTELHKIEIEKVSYFHKGFTNQIQTGHLKINAERMSLKELFGILIKTDTSNIKFESKQLENEYYSIVIEQKKQENPIGKIVFNKILENWDLKLTEEKYKSYQIKIQDTLKYSNLNSNSGNMVSKIVKTKDSITINNCDLKKIVKVLNSEYPEQITYNNESERIDYSWKKTTFEKLKAQMKNDFGILFLDSKNDISIFTIKNN
jgi:hypothetical protein